MSILAQTDPIHMTNLGNLDRIRQLENENAHLKQALEDSRASIKEGDRQIASLIGEVQRLSGPTIHMRHVKTHDYYDVLARGAQMQCAFPVSHNAKVTVYRGADGQIQVRPDGEFWDGVRFVPSDATA